MRQDRSVAEQRGKLVEHAAHGRVGGQRPFAAIASDGATDDPGIDLREGVVVDAKAFEDAETVNGSIKADDRIQGDSLATVNGSIRVGTDARLGGDIEGFRVAGMWVSLVLLSGLVVLPFLPETKDQPLPDE